MECPNCGNDVTTKTEAVMGGIFWIVLVLGMIAFPIVLIIVKKG